MATELRGQGTPDWGTLILEVQTDPRGSDRCPALWSIYGETFPYLKVLAAQWLRQGRMREGTVHDVASAGWDKVCKELTKFDIPDDTPEGIGRAFKAWVSICCSREWKQLADGRLESAMDPMELAELIPGTASSPEDLLEATEEGGDGSAPEVSLRQEIFRRELSKLPESLQEAILESEDGKSVLNPNARGKTGEAAAIAKKYGYTTSAIRTARSRLLERVRTKFNSEVSNDR